METCPIVECTLANRKFKLALNFDALALVERETGLSFLGSENFKNLNCTSMTAIFWAAAKQTEPGLTLAQVRQLPPATAPEMLDAIRAAWNSANDAPEQPERPSNGPEQR